MSDFFEQYKKQQQINESLFGKIFPKKQQTQPIHKRGTENGGPTIKKKTSSSNGKIKSTTTKRKGAV